MARPLNYMTKIAARRTMGECQDLLGQAGASAVAVMFDQRVPVGLSFQIDTPAGRQTFRMPVNWRGVHAQLRKLDAEGGFPASYGPKLRREITDADHAIDVAWRVVKDWLEAQLAIIATGMTSLDEVMTGYLEVAPGVTVHQAIVRGATLELEATRDVSRDLRAILGLHGTPGPS